MHIRWLHALPLLLIIGASCAGTPADQSDRVQVVASFYPLAFAAEEVGGDLIQVENLTPPGAEPHDLELSPGQVTSLTRADLVIYLGDGFQPSVEEALSELKAEIVDVLSGQKIDPHIWLDPIRTSALAQLISDRLGKIDPDDAHAYRSRAASLESRLKALDDEFSVGLTKCARSNVVTSHEAFGYLAAAYNLEQVGIAGLDPEQEPSAARLAEVADFVRKNGVTTIYFEVLVSPDLAETLARETGVKTAKLDPLEGPPTEGDYFSAMRANLEALREGLGCS